MEPTVVFLIGIPFVVFGVWVFWNPEGLWEMGLEPGIRNAELNEIGRTRERLGGVMLMGLPLLAVVLVGDVAQLLGDLGIIAFCSYWFSDFRSSR